jgi:hypothetical protein
MFQQVTNIGGRAACQDNPDTFAIMRQSQFAAWEPEVIASYLKDLQTAKAAGRNLIFEKYTHMARNNDPVLYERNSDKLPPISAAKEEQARLLTKRLLREAEKYSRKYPALSSRGRPLSAGAMDPWNTSVETYQMGELLTYSDDTLHALSQQLDRLEAEGRNLVEEILLNTVRRYGYDSLSSAEKQMRGSLV